MAHLHRLIFAALVLLSAWLPSTSYAAFPASGNQVFTAPDTNPAGYLSAEALCAEQVTYYVESPWRWWKRSPKSHVSLDSINTVTKKCRIKYVNVGDSASAYQYDELAYSVGPLTYSCPANSTLSGSTCTCNSGFTESGSSCVVPDINNCPQAGTSAGRWSRPYIAGKGITDPYAVCDGETPSGASDGSLCVVSVVGDIAVGSPYVVYGQATYTGAKSSTCNGDGGTGTTPGSGNTTPPVQGEPAPTPCKPGYAPGTVNGVTSCYPAGATGKPVTTPSTSTTTTSVDGNTPTSSGTSSSVTCQLGQCTTTTTTTTTDAAGVTSTTATTKSESEGDFCKSNPRSSQCVTSAWGGSCTANFTCDGDAVMCAISKEQHIRNCKLFDDRSSAEAVLYDAQKNKEGSQTSGLPGSETKAIGSASFDTSDAIGGGTGCIADKSVTVAGSVVTIPFSTVCGHLAMLGNILLAVSFLLAGRIVVRG